MVQILEDFRAPLFGHCAVASPADSDVHTNLDPLANGFRSNQMTYYQVIPKTSIAAYHGSAIFNDPAMLTSLGGPFVFPPARIHNEPGKEEVLSAKLHGLRQQLQEVRRQVRDLSPKLDALIYPEALSLAQIQAMLDPGTLLLSYSVSEGETILYRVRKPKEFKMVAIPKGDRIFKEKIRRKL